MLTNEMAFVRSLTVLQKPIQKRTIRQQIKVNIHWAVCFDPQVD